MKNLLIIILCIIILGLFFTFSVPRKNSTLPKPTGKHSVGITFLNFTDDSRKELFDNHKKKNREITVKAWYPTDTKTEPAPYFLNAEFAIKKCMFTEIFRDLKTNAGRDVPLFTQIKRYPVLIFSHGWGEHFSQNSILMEELASHGYIIFSIAYHFECRYSEYPDGRSIQIDYSSLRFRKIWKEQQNPKSMKLLHKMYKAANDEERKQVFLETSSTLPTLLKESPKYWAEDISFFLDQLKVINGENKIFKGRLDPERIGVFGMSMGGIASTEISMSDKRIKACINIDGGLYGSALEKTIQIPFMFLNSKRFLGYGRIFTGRSKKDCYSLSIRNSDHYNLTDYSLYPIPMVKSLLGEIEGKKPIEIMNVMVLAFFDKYLNSKQNIDLIKKAKEYPEIEVVSHF
jgi:hypothetical protein